MSSIPYYATQVVLFVALNAVFDLTHQWLLRAVLVGAIVGAFQVSYAHKGTK